MKNFVAIFAISLVTLPIAFFSLTSNVLASFCQDNGGKVMHYNTLTPCGWFDESTCWTHAGSGCYYEGGCKCGNGPGGNGNNGQVEASCGSNPRICNNTDADINLSVAECRTNELTNSCTVGCGARSERVRAGECRNFGFGTPSCGTWQVDIWYSGGHLCSDNACSGNCGDEEPEPTPEPTPPGNNPYCAIQCTNQNSCPYYNPSDYQTFPDVPASNPYFPYIQRLECDNVVHGFSDYTFKPYNSITRGQLAKILQNGFRFPENLNCGDFRDVPNSDKFYTEIRTLKCLGISNGFSDNTYRPANLITKGEAIKLIVNAARVRKGDPNFMPMNGTNFPYSDVQWHYTFAEHINAAHSNGVIDGSGYFYPDNYLTRGEMSKWVDIARAKL